MKHHVQYGDEGSPSANIFAIVVILIAIGRMIIFCMTGG